MQTKKLFHLLIIILSVFLTTKIQAKIWMTIDRTDIGAGETFVLDIRVDESTSEQPDLSRIPEAFTIVSNSQYQRTQSYNGNMSTVQGWKITLKTLKSGPITIPPINVGSQFTQPIQLNIKDSSHTLDIEGFGKAIFLEAKVDTESAYVQQQIIYTISLYRSINTHYASLTEPTADNTIIEKLGDDKQFEKHIDNRRYIVTQRKYAIFPQQSGELTISGVNFNAEINDSNSRRSSFLTTTRPISVSTKPKNISVKPKPANAPNPWLPASDVIIADKWTPQTTDLKVGEPITWTLLLTVQGLSESQLPEIKIPSVDGLQWYYDTPQKERQVNDKGIVGQRIEKIAVIPSKAGKITLPEITLKWWDVNSDSEKTAKLASRTFNVAANPNSQTSITPQQLPNIPKSQSPTGNQTLANSNSFSNNQANSQWKYAAIGLLILWLLTLLAYFKKPAAVVVNNDKTKTDATLLKSNKLENNKKLTQSLLNALDKQDYSSAENLLLKLVNNNSQKQFNNLGNLANAIKSEDLQQKVLNLQALRYARSPQEKSHLLKKSEIDQILKELALSKLKPDSNSIPPLYPS